MQRVARQTLGAFLEPNKWLRGLGTWGKDVGGAILRRACGADEVLKHPRKQSLGEGQGPPLTGPGVRAQISSFCEMMVEQKGGPNREPVPTGYLCANADFFNRCKSLI